MAAALLPLGGGLWSVASAACCAANACCTLASCCSCRAPPRAAKLLYLLLFLGAATLGIALRYWGEAALGSWVAPLRVCETGACFGQQAAYRISGALFAFHVVLAPLVAVWRAAHLGAWFAKLLAYVALLALTLAIPNDFWVGYSQLARYGSGVFLVLQVLIVIDFAYATHEALLARADAADAAAERAGYEPGLCSNAWKLAYVGVACAAFVGAVAGVGVLYAYFGQCALARGFLSGTLAVGVVLTIVSMLNGVGKGLLPPVLLFAYNAYLTYGALTNNPDATCNLFARRENENAASIFTGLAIAALSVTWAAYATAGSVYRAVAMSAASDDEGGGGGGSAAGAAGAGAGGGASTQLPRALSRDAEAGAAKKGGGVRDWPKDGDAGGGGGDAAAYQAGAASPRGTAPAARAAAAGDAEDPGDCAACCCAAAAGSDARPWVFHAIMALAGLYLAMLTTNWGTAEAPGAPSSNPELSAASMWVRIVSSWLIDVLYAWTLVAPLVCPDRDFS